MKHFVIISGCSGGGKSALLAELQRRGHSVIEEAGRRIVREELYNNGHMLPWANMHGFLHRAIVAAEHDHACAMHNSQQWVFFDRSLIDVASALQEITGDPILATVQSYQYHPLVFLAPPWPEIFMQDTERRHDMNTALAEFKRLQQVYHLLGYTVSLLPKVGVAERADFVLNTLVDH